MSRKKPRAFDLFSGCGGLTLGLKKAGFKVIGAIDNDELSMKAYRINHPEVKSTWLSDIRKVPAKQVLNRLGIKPGELSLLAGCPPCQGFSTLRTLNRRSEVSDKRNDLIDDYLRFVRVLKPKALLMENVPALAKNRRIKLFLKALNSLGYKIDLKDYAKNVMVADAANFGVPQRRKRMILVAAKDFMPDFSLPEIKKVTVKEAIGGLPVPGKGNDPLHDYEEERTEIVMKRIRMIPKNGGSRHDLGEKHQLKCHMNCDGFKDIYGRVSWDDVSPTITSGCTNPSKGRFLHPVQNRALTLREAAVLMTFPLDYVIPLDQGRQGAARLVGNAFPPDFVKHHAHMILEKLNV